MKIQMMRTKNEPPKHADDVPDQVGKKHPAGMANGISPPPVDQEIINIGSLAISYSLSFNMMNKVSSSSLTGRSLK
jgi:hypothetical protein